MIEKWGSYISTTTSSTHSRWPASTWLPSSPLYGYSTDQVRVISPLKSSFESLLIKKEKKIFDSHFLISLFQFIEAEMNVSFELDLLRIGGGGMVYGAVIFIQSPPSHMHGTSPLIRHSWLGGFVTRKYFIAQIDMARDMDYFHAMFSRGIKYLTSLCVGQFLSVVLLFSHLLISSLSLSPVDDGITWRLTAGRGGFAILVLASWSTKIGQEKTKESSPSIVSRS